MSKNKRKIKLKLSNDSFILDDVLDQIQYLKDNEDLEKEIKKGDDEKHAKKRKK